MNWFSNWNESSDMDDQNYTDPTVSMTISLCCALMAFYDTNIEFSEFEI